MAWASWCQVALIFVLALLSALVGIALFFQHNLTSYYKHRILEVQYKATILVSFFNFFFLEIYLSVSSPILQ